MQKSLAAAIALLTGLTSAHAQTASSKNILDMYAAAMTGGPVTPKPSQARGPSVSRACLSAQTRAVLAQFEGQFGEVKIVSTCRPGAVIAGSGKPSQHRYGKAVDFVPPADKRAAMIAWLRQNTNGAVITYRAGHVHFDTGPYKVYSCGDCGSRSVRRAPSPARWPLGQTVVSQSIPQ